MGESRLDIPSDWTRICEEIGEWREDREKGSQEAKRPRGQKGLLGQIALVIYRRTAEGREAQPLGWRIQGRGWVQQPGGPFNE